MSLSSTGSVAASRAADSRAWAWPARPHAQALRAAANVSSARCVASGGQGCRAFVGGQGGDVPAATFCAGPDELQRGDHLRVGALSGGGAMPRLPVRVADAGERVSQGSVRAPPLARRWPPGRSPNAPADGEPSRPGVGGEQPGLQGRLECQLRQAQVAAARSEHGELAGVVGGGEQQQRLHRLRAAVGSGRGRPAPRGLVRCSCAGSGEDPSSWAALSSVGSSNSASGLPRVSVMSRSVTSSARASPRRSSSSARAASGSSPVSDHLGKALGFERRRMRRLGPRTP